MEVGGREELERKEDKDSIQLPPKDVVPIHCTASTVVPISFPFTAFPAHPLN